MKQEFNTFKGEVDQWIKTMNGDLNKVRHIPSVMHEHRDNIDHNYELLVEMKREINKLREELQAVRMVQLLHLKQELKEA